MTLDRRHLFGLGALGLGAAALEGCASTPSSPKAPSAREVEHMLVELDLVLARLEAHDADPARFGIHSRGAEIEGAQERCLALLRTLCFLGAYRDVPDEVWDDPGVAAHLERALPRIEATLAAAHEQLEALDPAEARAIDERLARDPDLPMHIMGIVDAQAKEIGVPLEQRISLRTTTAQIAHRYRSDGARRATQKTARVYCRMLDARLAEMGVDLPRPERSFAFDGSRTAAAGSAPLRTLIAAPAVAAPSAAVEPATSKELMTTARKLAIAGAWCMIPPACGVGVLILLNALFLVIVAGIIHAGEE